MEATNTKKRRARRIILCCLGGVLLVGLLVLFLFWNRYVNKNSLIAGYESPAGQQVYVLGTLHKNHFNKLAAYSMEDVLSAVKNTEPDAVYIEAREAVFEEYGLVDGPVDMCVVYAYCQEQGIPVKFVDWWVIDNDFTENSTDTERDDHIFANISEKLSSAEAGDTVLAVCGSGHFSEQCGRFEAAGFERLKLKNKSAFFDDPEEVFHYPAGLCEVWEGRAGFYAYVNPELVRADETLSQEVKDGFWSWDHDAFYNEQLRYCELFKNDCLYE